MEMVCKNAASVFYRPYQLGNSAFALLVMVSMSEGSGHIDTAIWLHYMDADKTTGEEARRQLHKNAASNLEQVLAAPHKTPTVRPPASYHESYSS